MATRTNVMVSLTPRKDSASATRTGERIGVEIINAKILPIAAPLLNNPMPSGIVPQEHNGKILPILTDLISDAEDLPPKCF